MESLSQLVYFNSAREAFMLKGAPWHIEDAPQYPHRGLLIDSVRHFLPIATVKRIIDSITYSKFNALHWHLSDNEAMVLQTMSAPRFWDSAYTPFQETPDMLAALRTGKIKAVIYDEPAAAYNIAHEYDDCTILEVIPTGEQYGIIVNTDNVALAEAINNALAEMQADGTIAKLQEEWFGAAK